MALTRKDAGDMFAALPSYEGTPPLYYLLAWCWARVVGEGEAALRSLSALAGVAAVPTAWIAGRTLANRRLAFCAAAVVALSPIAVWYSQEARAYALATLLAGVSLVFFAREITGRGRSTANCAGWALASALALCTHYFAALVVVPVALWLLVRARDRRAAAIAALVPAATALALFPLATAQTPHAGGGETAATELHYRIPQVGKQMAVGYNLPADLAIGIVATAACALLAYLGLARSAPDDRRAARVGAAIAGAAAGLLLVLALVGPDYYLTRYLTVALIPAALVIAAGLRASRAGLAAGGALAVAFVAALVGVALDPLAQRPDYRGALSRMGAPPPGGRIVLISSPGALLETFVPTLRPVPKRGAAVREVVVINLAVVGPKILSNPRPAVGLVPAGFDEVARKRTRGFVRVVMRAPRPTAVSPLVLLGAGKRGFGPTVMLYQPAAG